MSTREEENVLDDFTYRGKPDETAFEAVRFLCGDTSRDVRGSLGDGEIVYLLKLEGIEDPDAPPTPHVAVLRAAIRGAEALAAKHAKEASYGIQGVSEQANQKASEYRRTAKDLRRQLSLLARPVFGGQTLLEKSRAHHDTSRVQSSFRRNMFRGD